jgi:hypothetical protein
MRLDINTYMRSCTSRADLRALTIRELMCTDWRQLPVVCLETPELSEAPLYRLMMLTHSVLERAAVDEAEFVLLLEDDLIFNVHVRHNLANWQPLRRLGRDEHFFASLLNLSTVFKRVDSQFNYAEVHPNSFCGSQALIISRRTAAYLAACWGMLPAMHADVKMARLAARVCPLISHVPSLVQHVGFASVWGGPFMAADDFNRSWKAALRPIR